MIDPLKKHLDKLKIIAESAKRRNNMYTDLAKQDNRQTKRSLSALHNAPAPGKKTAVDYGRIPQPAWNQAVHPPRTEAHAV